MTRLANMQPNFLPYIGYWQLIHAVDRFMIYDDVGYIKHGWINRNRILINECPAYITVPLYRSSSTKRICDIYVHSNPKWRDRLIKTLEITYRRTLGFCGDLPGGRAAHPLRRRGFRTISRTNAKLAAFMGLTTEFVMSCGHYDQENRSDQARVLEICKRAGSD